MSIAEFKFSVTKKKSRASEYFLMVWIASWFLACWVYHTRLFLMGIFAYILAIIIQLGEDEKEKKDK